MLKLFPIENRIPLQFLMKGLLRVKGVYLQVPYDQIGNGFQRPEASFTAELYHQLRILQSEFNYDDLILHLDLGKYRLNRNNQNTEIKCLNHFDRNNLRPDLVLHRAQNNIDKQLLICEIKMKGANGISVFYDLQKLIFYKSPRLKFKNAIIIFTGSKQELEEILVLHCTPTFLNCLYDNEILFATKEKKWQIFSLDK